MDDKNLAVRDGGRKKLGIRTKGMLEMLVKQVSGVKYEGYGSSGYKQAINMEERGSGWGATW